MLDWLGNLLNCITSWIPRIVIIPATHAGVKFKRGKVVVPLTPGVRFYWPLVSEVQTYPVVRQTFDFQCQSLTTKDGKTIRIAATVVGQIHDIVAALSANWDIDDTVGDMCRAAIADVVFEKTFEDLHANFKGLLRSLTSRVRAELKSCGVTVEEVRIMELSQCRMYKVAGDAAKLRS